MSKRDFCRGLTDDSLCSRLLQHIRCLGKFQYIYLNSTPSSLSMRRVLTLQRVPQESDMSSSRTQTLSFTSPTLSTFVQGSKSNTKVVVMVRVALQFPNLFLSSVKGNIYLSGLSWCVEKQTVQKAHQDHLADLASLDSLLVHQREVEAELGGETSAPCIRCSPSPSTATRILW